MPPLNLLLEEQGSVVPFLRSESLHSVQRVKSPERARRSRRVQFLENPESVHSVISRCEYSKDEIEQCWYANSSYYEFRQDISTTVYLLKYDPELVDDKKYTLRGAEGRVEETMIRRHVLKAKVRSTVMEEQADQRRNGDYRNDEWIANVYGPLCRESAEEAIQYALSDQEEASQYQQQTGTPESPKAVVQDSFFADDWISSISSVACGEYFSFAKPKEDNLQQTCSVDESGFDDSWLRDITVRG